MRSKKCFYKYSRVTTLPHVISRLKAEKSLRRLAVNYGLEDFSLLTSLEMTWLSSYTAGTVGGKVHETRLSFVRTHLAR